MCPTLGVTVLYQCLTSSIHQSDLSAYIAYSHTVPYTIKLHLFRKLLYSGVITKEVRSQMVPTWPENTVKYKCVPFWTNSGSQVLSYFKGLVLYEIYMDRIFP